MADEAGLAARAVVVHVGLPKTGTTFLQSLLWSHRDELRGQGVLLPGFGPREHLWASGDVREEPQLARRHPDAPGAWGRLADEVRRWPGRSLITHEFLCGASADQVGRAVDALGGREVHVVVTAREIVSLVTARWQEWVKNGATGPIDRYPPTEKAHPHDEWGWGTLDLADVLERWSAHVPRHRVHVICPSGPGEPRETLWWRFAAVLGVDPRPFDLDQAQLNPSLGLAPVEVLRRVNAELASTGSWSRARDRGVWIRGHLAEKTLAALGSEPYWPSQERVEALRLRGESILDQVRAGGYSVVGDLDTVVTPSALPVRRHPSELTDAELVPVAAQAIAALLQDVRGCREHAAEQEDAPRAPQGRLARLGGRTRRNPRRTRG